MASESKSASGGCGFLGLLCLLFIGLKLGHVIDWSWWWVMAPLWIPASLLLGFLGLCLFAAVLTFVLGGSGRRR